MISPPRGHDRSFQFLELAVAVAISLFGAKSPVALATIVGVLVEVPVMLTLVKIANRTTNWFPEQSK
jgi:ACR3 family arsenite transporter